VWPHLTHAKAGRATVPMRIKMLREENLGVEMKFTSYRME
jgi:hypothetical protein